MSTRFFSLRRCVLALVLFVAATLQGREPARPRILKVLPHYLDQQGRMALSPSLYERDAYQAVLRKDRALCSALRYDVQWKAAQKFPPGVKLKLKMELRTASGETVVLENDAKPGGFFSTWTAITLRGDQFDKVGEVTAWRASLWDGEKLLSDQTSFLW